MKPWCKIVIVLCIVLLITSCRKYSYPESTFKGSDPAVIENCPFHGKLTAYTVNGIDSLDLLQSYVDTTFFGPFHFNIRDCLFEFHIQTANDIYIHFGPSPTATGLAELDYEFSKDRKKIKITFWSSQHSFKKNIFISSETEWDIIRLTNDDKPFKIRKNLNNGNTYEIQIR